jgi:predicted membrane protein (TIGR00267 family)
MLSYFRFLFRITQAHTIFRRYFVVNGFDGALTTLGLIIGFYSADQVAIPVMISACLGAAIALAVSGFSSAYVSEAAEREKALKELEQSLIKNLDGSAHSMAARLVPVFVAIVNGLAPLSLSLIIILPLFLAQAGIKLPYPPLESATAVAFITLFLLGAFLGKISGQFWLWSSLRTLFIALITAAIILSLDY